MLAAVLAREAGRSATWSALLSAGVGGEGVPARPVSRAAARRARPAAGGDRRCDAGAASARAIVLACGDEFSSAVSYHAERGLQIESLAATPLEIAAINDVDRAAEYGSGSFNFPAPAPSSRARSRSARWSSSSALVLWVGLAQRAVSHLKLATALLAVIVVLSPVLSPQFLFWLLPISAAAYGLGDREPRAAGGLRADPADAPVLRAGRRRLRPRVRLAAGGPQRAAADLPRAGLRADRARGDRRDRPAAAARL